MNPRSVVCLLALVSLIPVPAHAQFANPRRLAMGGVAIASGGPGSEGANVAYRAVPRAPASYGGIGLPIGVVQLLSDLPEFDSDEPDFNAYELANLLYNLPWNYQLGGTTAPSSDITITVAKDRLAVDLGEVGDVFPKEKSRVGAVMSQPLFTIGVKRAFVGIVPLVHYENELDLNDALRSALRDGEDFRTGTQYSMTDAATAQAAVGLALGWAGPLAVVGDARTTGGHGLYVGARGKLLRGLAYGDADNLVSFTTSDTLFGSDPVDVRYHGLLRSAEAADGGFGAGLDVGAVWVAGPLELGLGVNDIGTRLHWKVQEELAETDTVENDVVSTTLREGADFTSEVPVTVTANAALRLGTLLLAADVQRTPNATLAHAGAELWRGRWALRAGAMLDAYQDPQVSGGVGVRLGRIGLDAAVATHSRNVQRERTAELGLGLTFYPGGER